MSTKEIQKLYNIFSSISKNKGFSARQQKKLIHALFFGHILSQKITVQQNDIDGDNSNEMPVKEIFAALTLDLSKAMKELPQIAVSDTDAVEILKKSKPAEQNNMLQKASKCYYQLLYLYRINQAKAKHTINTTKKCHVDVLLKNLQERVGPTNNTVHDVKLQKLIYKAAIHGLLDDASLNGAAAELQLANEATQKTVPSNFELLNALLDPALRPNSSLSLTARYELAKQVYRLLSYKEFSADEQKKLKITLQAVIHSILLCSEKSASEETKKRHIGIIYDKLAALSQTLPMSLDPKTGIQGILNGCHDFFKDCMSVCDDSAWLLLPWLIKWLLFKPLTQLFVMFKRVRVQRDPCEVLNKLIDATVLEDKHKISIKQPIRSVVSREKFWRVFGYISAVSSAIGCGVVTAVALAALGGVPLLPVMVIACLVSGIVSNYYLHKDYVPNTWVRFMEKGLFKDLTTGQLIATGGGVVLAFVASLAICAITYVDMNYALLLIGAKLGYFNIAAGSLTFVAAATPWLLTPMGVIIAALLLVSLFIAVQTFITNFPLYIRDYTDFIREHKWRDVFKFFTHFFAPNETNTAKRLGNIAYNTLFLALVVIMSLSLAYFAMLPTSVAFAASAVAIVGVMKLGTLSHSLYHSVVWGNLIANIPFVLQNIVNFCQRSASLIMSIAVATFACAVTLCSKTEREYWRQTLSWSNLSQAVREIAGIKENATSSQLILGGFVFVGLILILFGMVVINAFGNGKVGQEGGDIIANHAPFYLSQETAEVQVLAQSSFMSYLFCYLAMFPDEQPKSSAGINDIVEVKQRAQYSKLIKLEDNKDISMVQKILECSELERTEREFSLIPSV